MAHERLDVDEWQVRGIMQASASLDRGERISHERVKAWVASWATERELPKPQAFDRF